MRYEALYLALFFSRVYCASLQVLGGDDDAEPTTPSGSLTGSWAGDAAPPASLPPSPLAPHTGGRDSAVGRTPGTPAYTAPECTASGAFSGEAADVWCAPRRASGAPPSPLGWAIDACDAGRWGCRCTPC